jgi:glycosyltransferase involved in cell wall biosynthesis
MRIVHVTSVHVWDDNRIFNKMCRSLALRGHEIHLVAAMPGNQDGKVVHGVTLHAVSVPSNRGARFLKTAPEVLAKARLVGGDLYHFHDPELLLYIGRFRSAMCKPVIYDVHEDYPAAILSKSWVPAFCRSLVSRTFDIFERRRVMGIDGLIVAWPKIMDRFGNHPRKVLINNYPYRDELQFIEGEDQERRLGCFVYAGVLSPKRGVLEMVRAVGRGGNQFKLILGGNWSSDQYREKCQADSGWNACEYRGFLSRNEMRDLFAVAQAGLIAFFPEPNHLYSIPNKIFEYMSAGLPVIASDLPVQRSIVDETGCGLVADARSPDAICERMRWIHGHPDEAEAMGRAGRQAIEHKYNWESEVEKLLTFYEDVLRATSFPESAINSEMA